LNILPISVPTYLCPIFFTPPAPTETYTLSLHDALPIFAEERARALATIEPKEVSVARLAGLLQAPLARIMYVLRAPLQRIAYARSEEHTSELQSRFDLVCRLLLEKKKK